MNTFEPRIYYSLSTLSSVSRHSPTCVNLETYITINIFITIQIYIYFKLCRSHIIFLICQIYLGILRIGKISQSRNQFSCSPLYVVKRSYVCPFCRVVVKLALNILNEVYVYCFTKRYNQPITFIWFTFILIIIITWFQVCSSSRVAI